MEDRRQYRLKVRELESALAERDGRVREAEEQAARLRKDIAQLQQDRYEDQRAISAAKSAKREQEAVTRLRDIEARAEILGAFVKEVADGRGKHARQARELLTQLD